MLPLYIVHIVDGSPPPAGERVPQMAWVFEADTADAALDLGYKRWDEKYTQRPIAPRVRVERFRCLDRLRARTTEGPAAAS